MKKEKFIAAYELQSKIALFNKHIEELQDFIAGKGMPKESLEKHEKWPVNSAFQIIIQRKVDNKRLIIAESNNAGVFDFLQGYWKKEIDKSDNDINNILNKDK